LAQGDLIQFFIDYDKKF